MTTTIHPQALGREPGRKEPKRSNRTQHGPIEGRYRPIRTNQIVMAWWLFSAGHISKRALRAFFALHEMVERRHYTAKDKRGCATYGLPELKALVGGRGSKTADYALSGDLRRLSELGLVQFATRSITFAQSFDQIAVEDNSGLYAMWEQMHPKTRGRAVPVPRRTLRALAAGFTTADTAYILAALIRSVFHQTAKGSYTTDGRTKDIWVAETFGLSLKAIRTARKHLAQIGWLEEQPTHQNLRNLYGTHVTVNVDWSPSDASRPHATDVVDNPSVGEGRSSGGSSTHRSPITAENATPRNRSALSKERSKNQRSRGRAPDPSGDCIDQLEEKNSDRRSLGEPNIRDIQPEDLADTGRLLELRQQAIALGMAFQGELGEHDFLALANRARTRGRKPAALFFDLISNHRTAFITIADEEEGRRRQKEHHYGTDIFRRAEKPKRRFETPTFTQDEAIVLACQKRLPGKAPEELFRLARRHLDSDWTLDRWQNAHLALVTKDARRWSQDEDCLATSDFAPMREMYA